MRGGRGPSLLGMGILCACAAAQQDTGSAQVVPPSPPSGEQLFPCEVYGNCTFESQPETGIPDAAVLLAVGIGVCIIGGGLLSVYLQRRYGKRRQRREEEKQVEMIKNHLKEFEKREVDELVADGTPSAEHPTGNGGATAAPPGGSPGSLKSALSPSVHPMPRPLQPVVDDGSSDDEGLLHLTHASAVSDSSLFVVRPFDTGVSSPTAAGADAARRSLRGGGHDFPRGYSNVIGRVSAVGLLQPGMGGDASAKRPSLSAAYRTRSHRTSRGGERGDGPAPTLSQTCHLAFPTRSYVHLGSSLRGVAGTRGPGSTITDSSRSLSIGPRTSGPPRSPPRSPERLKASGAMRAVV